MRFPDLLILLFLLVIGCTTEKSSSTLSERPDSLAKTNPEFESEEAETERLLKERAEEDELAYEALSNYDGSYLLDTESEGASGTLTLKYNKDRTFDFVLEMEVPEICSSRIEGEIFMDRTAHGLYQNSACILHVNFMGSWEAGAILEVDQPEACSLMKGECTLTGRYVAKPK